MSSAQRGRWLWAGPLLALLVLAACGDSGEGHPPVGSAPVEAVASDETVPDGSGALESPEEPGEAEEPVEPEPGPAKDGGTATFTIDNVTEVFTVDCHFIPGVELVAVIAMNEDPAMGANVNSSLSTAADSSLEVRVGGLLWGVGPDAGGRFSQLDIDVEAATITGAAIFVSEDFDESTGVFHVDCGSGARAGEEMDFEPGMDEFTPGSAEIVVAGVAYRLDGICSEEFGEVAFLGSTDDSQPEGSMIAWMGNSPTVHFTIETQDGTQSWLVEEAPPGALTRIQHQFGHFIEYEISAGRFHGEAVFESNEGVEAEGTFEINC